jgi:hypothetical protein
VSPMPPDPTAGSTMSHPIDTASMTVDQILRRHQQNMRRIYDQIESRTQRGVETAMSNNNKLKKKNRLGAHSHRRHLPTTSEVLPIISGSWKLKIRP